MKLRNLSIIEQEIDNKEMVIDGLKETGVVLENNYEAIKSEVGIEFNIGSRLGETR